MRSVKPEFFADQEITLLSRDIRLLYIGLWGLADEHGRLQGDPRYVKGQLFAYDDDLTAGDIEKMLDCLIEAGKAHRYRVRNAVYLFLPKLAKHQRLEPAKVPSRLPSPNESERGADESEPDANESERGADESEPDAKKSTLSMWHVAGGMEHGAAREPITDSDPFAEFWDTYPRREAKGSAKTAFAQAIQKGTPAETILDAARRYRDDPNLPEREFIPHPATWLDRCSWEDDPLPERNTGRPELSPVARPVRGW
jgi:hypothetical protein